ncbi:hypothetical protein K474DRAFT_1713096 [Panus rudis PR-1116 ss-1]|nr:hypothetical protein K474DRAFT_1713096 [Panus rudis PR-1116 ss-1]
MEARNTQGSPSQGSPVITDTNLRSGARNNAVFIRSLSIVAALSFVLYGITVAQTYHYFQTYEKDPVWLKSLVAAVFITESVYGIFILNTTFRWLVIASEDPLTADKFSWSDPLERYIYLLYNAKPQPAKTLSALQEVVVVLVQIFYVRRIWKLGKHTIWLVVLTVSVVAARFACNLAISARIITSSSVTEFISNSSNIEIVDSACISAMIADALIVGSLTYYLREMKTGSKFKRSNDIVRWIMYYTVNTGVIAMLLSVVIVTTSLTIRRNFIWIALVTFKCRVYANAFLGTLNTRKLLNRGIGQSVTYPLSAEREFTPQVYEMKRLR